MLIVEVKVRASHTILRTHTQEREGGGKERERKGITRYAHTYTHTVMGDNNQKERRTSILDRDAPYISASYEFL